MIGVSVLHEKCELNSDDVDATSVVIHEDASMADDDVAVDIPVDVDVCSTDELRVLAANI